jgi:hypothetical protein
MSVQITRDIVALLKSCLRTTWPSVKSSHADEAIAAYYGFRTHAALLAALSDESVVRTVEPRPEDLVERLQTFGYRKALAEFDRVFRLFHAEIIGRTSENFRRMPSEIANDNNPQ